MSDKNQKQVLKQWFQSLFFVIIFGLKRMKEFKVSIDAFDGPLDLMLHLIKEKELDLMNLDINVLTDQYIAYLESMETLHLEIAGEYLVEMATLIEYKSKRMIPGNRDEIDSEYEEDPRERLIKRLLEYQQFKEASASLNFMFEERQKMMTRPLSEEAEQFMVAEEEQYRGNPYELMKAMRKCMMRMQLSKPIETKYTVKEMSMEDRELEVKAMLDKLPNTFRFESLLEDCKDVPMFIVTFLSVLDLARQHILYFTIDEEENIWFSKGVVA